MSTANELLKNLRGSEGVFNNSYDIFIKQCLSNHNIGDTQQSSKFNDIMTALKNKYTVPLLIEKLLTDGSVYFHECNLSLYNSLYQNNNDMLLSYTEIVRIPELKKTYLDNGADIAAFAITTAQYWEIQQAKNMEITGACICEEV